MLEWLKPRYHFTPEKNWMNDPNGLCYVDGAYHLFYQHNPNADVWGDIHWGHAVSDDLIHWRRLPIAFGPSVQMGEKHCYSGSVAIDGGVARAFYTSVGEGARGPDIGAQQWMACSRDGLMTWQKHPDNPIIPLTLHPELKLTYWRDPFLWKGDDGAWYAVLGGTLDGCRGCVLLYQSDDLIQWRFLRVLYETQAYPLLECPNFIPIGDRCVLLYSPLGQIHYHVGKWMPDKRFHSEASGILDGGSGRNGFYAPNTYMDLPGDRRVLMGWLSDKGRENQRMIRGWAGAQSLPRELRLEGTRLAMDFVPECKSLRRAQCPDFAAPPHRAEGFQIEMELELALEPGADVRMTLLASADGAERTILVYDGGGSMLRLEREASTRLDQIDVTTLCQKVALAPGGKLALTIYVDGSVIEVCANHQVMLTGRVYPSSPGACRHQLEAGRGVRVLSARAWLLESLFD